MEDSIDTTPVQTIDVEKVFASKDEKLLKRIPGFVIRYLKRIVHQDEINEFLLANRGIEGIQFIRNVTGFLGIKIKTVGLENVPRDGRLIFASNHPLGGVDGLCLMQVIHDRIRENPKSLSNDLLMNIHPLRSFMIGINKHGGHSREYVAEMQHVFEGNDPVIFFASGLVSRRKFFRIEDLTWKGTFVKKSFLYERDVIPVFISGRVSGFFYRLANLRKLLGIRYNIEMLYLPNEMFKQRGMTLTIKFGKPIPWRSFNSSKSADEWAVEVKKEVYRMGREL